jgi:lysophospholipid hydrolase
MAGGSDTLLDLARSGVQRHVDDAQVLFRQGDLGSTAMVLTSGTVAVYVGPDTSRVLAGRLHAPCLIGEVAALAGFPRTSTVIADGAVEVAEVNPAALSAWMAANPALGQAIAAEAHQRFRRSQLTAMAAQLVGGADDAAVAAIVDAVDWVELPAGSVLFEQGEEADAMYFVLSGRLQAVTDGVMVGEVGRGEIVGETAILANSPRTATVRTLRDTSVARLAASEAAQMLSEHPQLTLGVARRVVQRLTQPRAEGRRPQLIGVSVIGGLDPMDVPTLFDDALSPHGDVLVLSSQSVDAALDAAPGSVDGAQAAPGTMADAQLTNLLDEAQNANRFVVLVADPAPTAWTRRVAQLADRLLVVIPASPTAAQRDAARALVGCRPSAGPQPWLVMVDAAAAVHPTPSATTGVRALFEQVHHVRVGNEGDTARVARLAAGVGVGLVLGGGGARGFAHIGVLRALRQHGVPVDTVGGASMGSIFAAASALYHDPDEMMRVCGAQFERLLDYTIPVVSLLKAKRISANLNNVFGAFDAEDLWTPFYCVSTNLTRNRQEVHRSGSLATAVRASIAIPGVLPPVPLGDDLLVDGGVLDNVPVGAMMADPNIGTLLVVDVAASNGPRAGTDYGMHLSGWQAIRGGRKGTDGSAYPGVGTTIVRTMITASEGKRAHWRAHADVDLYLEIDLPGIGLLEFQKMDAVADRGYQIAEPLIAAWSADASFGARTPM